jgi:hypothetical protein
MHRNWVALVFLILLVIPGLAGARPEADQAAIRADLARQRRDAARKTFEVTWINYRQGRAGGDTLYRWSRRWLKAERELSDRPAEQVAAFKAHLDRMRNLERLVQNVQPTGQTTVDEVSGAAFYRAEAELWWFRAQEKKDR